MMEGHAGRLATSIVSGLLLTCLVLVTVRSSGPISLDFSSSQLSFAPSIDSSNNGYPPVQFADGQPSSGQSGNGLGVSGRITVPGMTVDVVGQLIPVGLAPNQLQYNEYLPQLAPVGPVLGEIVPSSSQFVPPAPAVASPMADAGTDQLALQEAESQLARKSQLILDLKRKLEEAKHDQNVALQESASAEARIERQRKDARRREDMRLEHQIAQSDAIRAEALAARKFQAALHLKQKAANLPAKSLKSVHASIEKGSTEKGKLSPRKAASSSSPPSPPHLAGDKAIIHALAENRRQIASMSAEIKRLKLLDQDKYALLYKRLQALQARLDAAPAGGQSQLLTQSQAAVEQGQSMLAQAAQPQQQAGLVAAEAAEAAPAGGGGQRRFEDEFKPEALFSGYNLGGGDQPGKHLDETRVAYLLHSKRRRPAVAAVTPLATIQEAAAMPLAVAAPPRWPPPPPASA